MAQSLAETIHRYAVVGALGIFLVLIFSSTGSAVHSRLLGLGDWIFSDYYLLRADLPIPECNPHFDVDARVQTLREQANDVDGLDGLFSDATTFDEQATRASIEKAQQLCQDKHDLYAQAKREQTLGLKVFRTVETAVELLTMFVFEYQKLLMVLLLLFGAMCTSLLQHHITFRPITTLFEYRFSLGSEFLVLVFFIVPSIYGFLRSHEQSNVAYLLSLVGFSSILVVVLWRLIRPERRFESVDDASWQEQIGRGLLVVPIYVYMAVIAGVYFFFVEQHVPGLAVYIGQIFEQPDMFLKVGLYIWLGMLLKEIGFGALIFDVLRPFGFSAGVLAILAVILMAVPTAYTGASGIIIIAMGAIAYQELRAVGARRSLAFAATAMTGSSGVVLRPCLLIVLIAALNKEVVTADLYEAGLWVFALSMGVLFFLLSGTGLISTRCTPWSVAKAPFQQALRALSWPLVIFVAVSVIYRLLLDARLDEISAPLILPVAVLSILWFQSRLGARVQTCDAQTKEPIVFRTALSRATGEAVLHTGALLMLMAFSFALGGVIERTELISVLPDSFSSAYVCMALLVLILVVIGMIMDPFGAVVLVSSSIATLAYKNGIDPLHFWIVTLVAFELGYLTPPVALNHLLARQVVGDDEALAAQAEAAQAPTFWLRNEKILLPLTVMAITLVITAFGPLIF